MRLITLAFAAVLSAALACAQTGNPVLDGLQRGIEARRQIEQLKLQQRQQQMEEERVRREDERRAAEVRRQAAAATTQPPFARSPQMDLAVAQVREMYPDFDKYTDVMTGLLPSFASNPERVSDSQYVEVLYLVAKHASFTAPARDRIAAQTTKP